MLIPWLVQELLASNPLNAVSFRKANGFSYMLQTVADVKLPWVLDLIVQLEILPLSSHVFFAQGVEKNLIQTCMLFRMCESIVEILRYTFESLSFLI